MVASDHGWYFSFENRVRVLKTDASFREVAHYERAGSGPGELMDARTLVLSDRYVWVTDFVGHAVHRLTLDLAYVDRLSLEFRPFSIYTINDSVAWFGSMDMEYSDIHEAVVRGGRPSVRRVLSRKVAAPPESITLFTGQNGVGVQFHPYTNQVTLLQDSTRIRSFPNPTRPGKPQYRHVFGGPMPEGKIHHSVFQTKERVCVLSGEYTPTHHDAACFGSRGSLVRRLQFRPHMTMTATRNDTLYTYSPETHHVYRYPLDF